jgi:hypothetical protein
VHEGSLKLTKFQGRKYTISGPLSIQKKLELQDLNLSCCNDAKFANLRLFGHGLRACEIPSNCIKIAPYKEIKARTSSEKLPVKILMRELMKVRDRHVSTDYVMFFSFYLFYYSNVFKRNGGGYGFEMRHALSRWHFYGVFFLLYLNFFSLHSISESYF